MNNITESKYAEWLEGMIEKIIESKPEKIGIVFIGEDDLVYTGYFGDCYPTDKAVMAHWFNTDAMMDTVLANSRMILETAEDDTQEDYEDE